MVEYKQVTGFNGNGNTTKSSGFWKSNTCMCCDTYLIGEGLEYIMFCDSTIMTKPQSHK